MLILLKNYSCLCYSEGVSMKSKGRPFGDKKSEKKSKSAKKIERGPYSLVRFCMLSLESEK